MPKEGEVGAAVAAVVAAAGAEVQQQQQQQLQVGSPAESKEKRSGGRKKKGKKGRRGRSRALPGAMAEVASTAKNALPSPSGPMPRGLTNWWVQNKKRGKKVANCLGRWQRWHQRRRTLCLLRRALCLAALPTGRDETIAF